MSAALAGARPTAAVIGAGFGGLALAIRLQSAGHQVTVFEKRDKPGGRAYVYEQDGFTFDGGPTMTARTDQVRSVRDALLAGMGDPNVMLMCLIFLLAGAFAHVSSAIGAVDAVVALGIGALPAALLLPGLSA